MECLVANKIKLPVYINFLKIVSAFESAINNLTTNWKKKATKCPHSLQELLKTTNQTSLSYKIFSTDLSI